MYPRRTSKRTCGGWPVEGTLLNQLVWCLASRQVQRGAVIVKQLPTPLTASARTWSCLIEKRPWPRPQVFTSELDHAHELSAFHRTRGKADPRIKLWPMRPT